MTVFDLSTPFHTDLVQSEASWKRSSTSDWLIEGDHTFGILVVITIKQHKNSECAADFLTDFFANIAQLMLSNLILMAMRSLRLVDFVRNTQRKSHY